MVYFGPGITDSVINGLLAGDASLALGSMAVVWLYMWFHTKSLYYASLGMLEMLLAFPATYFIHRIVFNFYWMGILNFLSLFILLGTFFSF